MNAITQLQTATTIAELEERFNAVDLTNHSTDFADRVIDAYNRRASELLAAPVDAPQGFDWNNALVARVVEAASKLDRKITPEECRISKNLRDVALYYASNYAGNFDYMLKMRAITDRNWTLSPAQCAGVLNCLMNEYRYNQKRASRNEIAATLDNGKLPQTYAQMKAASETTASPEVNAPVAPACKNGTYTIVLDESGKYRTLRLVDCPEKFNKPVGTQIAQYLSGADNESNYTGFAFVSGTKYGIWGKHKANAELARALGVLVNADKEAQIDMGHAYALESGNCFICGRKLTVPASINRGMGPICAEKY
jgi:Family of unknown function (DUF6011)